MHGLCTFEAVGLPPTPAGPLALALPYPCCTAGKDVNGKDLYVGRAQKKAEREAMLRAK